MNTHFFNNIKGSDNFEVSAVLQQCCVWVQVFLNSKH